MAGPFTGMFTGGGKGGGGGLNGAQLAEYKQKLAEYEEARQLADRKASLQRLNPLMDAAEANMSPERQAQNALFRAQQGETGFFDAGQKGMSTNFSQRGSTLENIAANEEARTTHATNRDYDIANPLPGSENQKMIQAREFIEMARQDPTGKYDNVSDADLAQIAWRNQPMLDTETAFTHPLTGKVIPKDVYGNQIVMGLGENTSERLANFKINQRAANARTFKIDETLGSLKRLDDNANSWTTGYGSYLRYLPETEANEWYRELKTLDAKTVLDTMEQLKSMSQTGSTGWGAVNMAELQTMMGQWGIIDETMDDKDIKEIIQRRISILTDFKTIADENQRTEEKWYQDNRAALPKQVRDSLDPLPDAEPVDLSGTSDAELLEIINAN